MIRETGVQSQVESYQKYKKRVLDVALVNTQHYKVRIKGKVGQYRENVIVPSLTPSSRSLLWSITLLIYVQGTMGKLSSKFRINENNTGISFYQIYLPN